MEVNNSIRGIYQTGEKVYLQHVDDTVEEHDCKPFAWVQASNVPGGSAQKLEKGGEFSYLAEFEGVGDYREYIKDQPSYAVRNLEHQYLLRASSRMFGGMRFGEIRRMQCDIETASSKAGSFSNAKRKGDRVLAIGMKMGDREEILVLEEDSEAGEKALLERFTEQLQSWDPDVIEGHNFFKFDLDYLKQRYKMHKLPMLWGRFGQEATFRNSRLKVAERWVDFPRCDIPGRTVFDTYLMIQLYDVTKRELQSYGLKSVARALGISKESERTYIDGVDIQTSFNEDREQFLAYLRDDLRETKGIADLLLPTYVAQVQNFPMTLQECTLRGTGTKVELLFLEKYYHARYALPAASEVSSFAGGFTKSFEVGVFDNVWHFDVASLYPSLLIHMGKNPVGDTLGCFIPTLKELREYRLEYKKKAREAEDVALKEEYEARQQSFKVLINSFYGYLGFEGGRFADSALAAELTAKGRQLLQDLIERFQALGCQILEADTDGIYLSAGSQYKTPESLLELVREILPKGVELEFDGHYEQMFSYKSKNYALLEGDRVIVRGSALRSRGIEPFLKELTDCLIRYLLGVEEVSPLELVETMRAEIVKSAFPVERLAKSERLSQNPEAYAKAVAESKKPRRASLEAALKMEVMPKMGESVRYFITHGEKARSPDWQRAIPIGDFDKKELPYDPKYYEKKLNDWVKRYGEFLPSDQGELFSRKGT